MSFNSRLRNKGILRIALKSVLYLVIISYPATLIHCGGSKESNKSEDTKEISEKTSNDTLTATGKSKNLDLKKMTDEEKLMIFNLIPKRITYQDAKAILPEMGELKTEGGGSFDPNYGLYESFLYLEIFGRPAKIEFNYRNDSLYTYYFFISNIDSSLAEEIYSNLQRFYEGKFGPYAKERETWEYFSESSYWELDTFNFSISKSIYTKDNAIIGWGF